MAVLGEKFAPTSHGCWLYHALAFSAVHRDWAEAGMTHSKKTLKKSFANLDANVLIVPSLWEFSVFP